MFLRKVGQRSIYSLIVVVLALALATPALAAFGPTTYQAAKRVLGQPDFVSSPAVTTQTGMYFPRGIAVDPATHKVFVADSGNNRVLRYASLYALTNGAAAQAVFGQAVFTTNTAATTQNGMSNPSGLFVDAGGRLWVADTGNNRVLRFNHAATAASGANANIVLGQPNFTTNTANTTRNGMNAPSAVFVDAGGRLWVADSVNSRVLRFNSAATRPNGANAAGVLGQLNFTSGGSATAQNRMAYPNGVAVDAAGRLWVGDTVNNRVLRFDAAASKANGAKANGVLGQPNFTSSTNATTRKGMFEPDGVAVDASGHLYVADHSQNRVLVYNAAAGLANGANASYVLGQNVFTSNASNFGGISAKSLNFPYGVYYDPHAQVLYVADEDNHRVLMFGKPTP